MMIVRWDDDGGMMMMRRRWREEEEKKEAERRVGNEKQEPHTEMWGIIIPARDPKQCKGAKQKEAHAQRILL